MTKLDGLIRRFNKQMDEAQKDFKDSERVNVKYDTRRNYMEEIFSWTLPLLLLFDASPAVVAAVTELVICLGAVAVFCWAKACMAAVNAAFLASSLAGGIFWAANNCANCSSFI